MRRMCVGFKGAAQPPTSPNKKQKIQNSLNYTKPPKTKENLFCSFSTISNCRFCDLTLTLQFIEERSETDVVSQLVIKSWRWSERKAGRKTTNTHSELFMWLQSTLSLSARCYLIQKALGLSLLTRTGMGQNWPFKLFNPARRIWRNDINWHELCWNYWPYMTTRWRSFAFGNRPERLCSKGHAALLWLNIELLNRRIKPRPITFADRSRMTTYCKRRYLEMTNLNNVVFNGIFYYLDLTMMPTDVRFDSAP